MIARPDFLEPNSREPLPNSTRVYEYGRLHPDLRVPMREIALAPTKTFDIPLYPVGKRELCQASNL